MMLKDRKAQVACALSVTIASFFVLNQATHPGRAMPMSTGSVLTDASANDTQAPSFETDITDRGSALLVACRQDAVRFCASVTPGEGRVVRCLSQRRDDLSDYCRSAMIQRHLNRDRVRQVKQD